MFLCFFISHRQFLVPNPILQYIMEEILSRGPNLIWLEHLCKLCFDSFIIIFINFFNKIHLNSYYFILYCSLTIFNFFEISLVSSN